MPGKWDSGPFVVIEVDMLAVVVRHNLHHSLLVVADSHIEAADIVDKHFVHHTFAVEDILVVDSIAVEDRRVVHLVQRNWLAV